MNDFGSASLSTPPGIIIYMKFYRSETRLSETLVINVGLTAQLHKCTTIDCIVCS